MNIINHPASTTGRESCKGEELYNRCLHGDGDAWLEVYNLVLSFTRCQKWCLGNQAEDMAQEIVCHLLTRGIDRVEKPAAFKNFIRTCARNTIIDSYKKKVLYAVSIDQANDEGARSVAEPVSPTPGPEARVMSDRFCAGINRGIESLSGVCRKTLTGYIQYKKGKFTDYAGLAAHFKVSVGTLSSRVSRCLDALRQVPEVRDWLEAGT